MQRQMLLCCIHPVNFNSNRGWHILPGFGWLQQVRNWIWQWDLPYIAQYQWQIWHIKSKARNPCYIGDDPLIGGTCNSVPMFAGQIPQVHVLFHVGGGRAHDRGTGNFAVRDWTTHSRSCDCSDSDSVRGHGVLQQVEDKSGSGVIIDSIKIRDGEAHCVCGPFDHDVLHHLVWGVLAGIAGGHHFVRGHHNLRICFCCQC